jgi:DnaJ domain
MSAVPTEIPDVGSTAAKLSQNPGFDPLRAGLSTEEYFVWSRFDGATSLRDLLLMTGFAVDHAIAIVRRLRGLGALLLPGENPATLAARAPAGGAGAGHRAATQLGVGAPAQPRAARPAQDPPTVPRVAAARPVSGPIPTTPRAATARPVSGPIAAPPPPATARPLSPAPPPDSTPPPPSLDDPTAEEKAALAEPADRCELSIADRILILAMQRRMRVGDPWLLIGVAKGADKKALKRAYFKLSKDVHPDRYYGKKLGGFTSRLSDVFEALAHAYAELTEDRTDERPPDAHETQAQAQTPAEYAAELFERACSREVAGAAAEALKIFDAAIRVDGQPRYLKRAAACALAADQPRVAEDYAKKAAALEPSDPSTQRLLARAFKAGGRLALAEEVLLMAMQLKNENDALGRELRGDLAEVRRLLARSQGY